MRMFSLRRWLCLALLLPGLAFARGAFVKTDEVQAQLVAHAPDGVVAGKPLWLGLLIRHAPHWHTYWKNPGDSGTETLLRWTLPAGVSAGPIAWPTPKRLPVGPLVNYGYEETVLLAVPVTVAPEFAAASLEVGLRADWLVCKEICIPQSGEFRLSVPAQSSTVAHAAAFEQARAALPRALPERSARAIVDARSLSLEVQGLPAGFRDRPVQVFPGAAGVIDHAAAVEQKWVDERLLLRLPLSAQRSESPPTMDVVLSTPGEAQSVELRVPVNGWTPVVGPTEAASRVSLSLVASLGFAFLGGLLLNLMPCVFPVLSLKVIGFAQHAQDRRQLFAGGLAYTLGVIVSFAALAGLLLVLRAAGDQLGWGFQLQSPVFVASLAGLFALIGLNLVGVFHVSQVLPSRLAALRSRQPLIDHGLTGVLAVAIASPCTAPFMGAALGAALAQPAPQALAVFVALGAGMAAPYLVASLWPGLSRWLPRPGAWMERFKIAMAFPMFATVVWLVWILGQQVGIDGAVGVLALIVSVAFALWVFFSTGWGRTARRVVQGIAVAIVAAVAVWAAPALLQPAAAPAVTTAAGATWQPWSPDALARVRGEGRPVFVDFTAAWCVTCQVNKRTTLGDDALMAAFRARQVVLMRADWTRHDAGITEALRQLGRTGVPVYALYAPGAREPQLLSELLTVSEVRDAMARWPSRDGEPVQPRLP
jgi:thiol:disulfide interchange protein